MHTGQQFHGETHDKKGVLLYHLLIIIIKLMLVASSPDIHCFSVRLIL